MNRLGPYELGAELARGGMGVVYRARDPYLGRDLAIKVIRDDGLTDPEAHERFRRETLTLAHLRHPGVVGVHSGGVTPQGFPYLVMDLLKGGSLAGHMGGDALAPMEAVRLAREIAEALAYTHSQGVLHRDVKPANVLLDSQGHAVLTDFGLAKLSGTQRLTHSGDILGTPSYMAPEQVRGDSSLSPAADVYALGAALFHMLTGRPPLVAGTVTDLFIQVQERVPDRVSRVVPAVGTSLDGIVSRCLEKSPENRYLDMNALAEDLRAWEKARSSATPPVVPAATRGGSRVGAKIALALVIGGAAGWVVGLFSGGTVDRATRTWRDPSELPLEYEISYDRGGRRLSREDFEGALADLQRVVDFEPGCSAAWRELGSARLRTGDAGGLEDLKRATELDPETASMWAVLGREHNELGDLGAAVLAYRRAIEIEPHNADYQISLAICLFKAGDKTGCREVLEESRRLEPRSGDVAIVEFVLSEAPLPERLKLLERGQVLDPGNPGLFARQGDYLLRDKQYPQAAEAYSEAIRRRISDPKELLGRAEARVWGGKPQEGFDDLATALGLYPDNPAARLLRGKALFAIGRASEAKADLSFAAEEGSPAEAELATQLYDLISKAESSGHYQVIELTQLHESPTTPNASGVLQVGERVRVLRHQPGSLWAEVQRGEGALGPRLGWVRFKDLGVLVPEK